MSTGNNIRNIRKEKGMTLQQIADILGCSPQLISQYESGKRQPKLETKKKIADALGCEISDIDENIYIVSPFNPTVERIEWFKLEAEATQIYEKAQNGETLTAEEREKIIDYEKQLKFQAEQREAAAKKAPKFIDRAESSKKTHKFFSSDKKVSPINDGKPPKFTDRSTSFEESKAQEEAHNLIDSIPNEEPLSWEREKIALQLRDILSTYSELNNAGREAAVKRIEELRYSDVMTDSRLDDIYFNRVKKKINKGEKLSSDEIEWWHNYLDKSVKTVGAIFESLFSMLNEEGRRKAHTQINRAIDQIEMLTKIPEYQKDTDIPPHE